MELPDGKFNRNQFNSDKAFVFQHAHRLIRCIIDCKLWCKDAVSVRNALELARCLRSSAWDNSPSMLRQLVGFGPVMVRKFVNANIKTFEALKSLDTHQLEMIAGKNPTWGSKVKQDIDGIPSFRLYIHSTKVRM